jgi:hypothetical protein
MFELTIALNISVAGNCRHLTWCLFVDILYCQLVNFHVKSFPTVLFLTTPLPTKIPVPISQDTGVLREKVTKLVNAWRSLKCEDFGKKLTLTRESGAELDLRYESYFITASTGSPNLLL